MIEHVLSASPASANLENNEFEAAWQRLLLLLETPEHFGVMFVFTGNDLLRQALLSRLEQAAKGRALAVQFLPEQPWKLPELNLTALDPADAEPAWLRTILADWLNTLLPATPALRVGILSLDGNLPLALHTALSAQWAWTPSDTSDPIQASIRWAHWLRRELLARLNERRTQLEQRGPLLILLPLDATKATAELAPDLWTVRLTSHYLQPQATNVDAPTLPPLPAAERTFGGEITPAHREILAHWQQRQQAGNTKGLQVWDGILALDTARALGLGKAAVQKIAQQVVALAYTRGTVREQMTAQISLGDVAQNNGELAQALESYQIAFNLAQAEHAAHPGSTLWQSDLSISHDKIGNIQQALGDLSGALGSYQNSLDICQHLAQHDAANTEWQRDLSVSHERIGDIHLAQGDLSGALGSYQKSLDIFQRLAQQDAANTEWQRDLSVAHIKIGDIQKAQGDLSGAQGSYQKSLDIRQRLVQQDAANTQWQRDLSVAHEKIGDIQQAQGDLSGALGSYRKDLEICQRLAQQDAANSEWQRDLSVAHERIGNIQQAQGDLSGALGSYRKTLEISQRLAQQDAANVQWQTDVVISCWKLAHMTQGEEAKGFLQRGLAILERLAQEDRLTTAQKGWMQMFRDALAQ